MNLYINESGGVRWLAFPGGTVLAYARRRRSHQLRPGEERRPYTLGVIRSNRLFASLPADLRKQAVRAFDTAEPGRITLHVRENAAQ